MKITYDPDTDTYNVPMRGGFMRELEDERSQLVTLKVERVDGNLMLEVRRVVEA